VAWRTPLTGAEGWRHNVAIPSVQIKNVPEETHAVLRDRAAKAHQSLQEYLLANLVEQASRPTMDEWVERVSARERVELDVDAVVADIRADRERH